MLNWGKLFEIIVGITRGILYFHQDLRLKKIHRDLKTSNVLLDGEMNPKILDFGIAHIFNGDQIQACFECLFWDSQFLRLARKVIKKPFECSFENSLDFKFKKNERGMDKIIIVMVLDLDKVESLTCAIRSRESCC